SFMLSVAFDYFSMHDSPTTVIYTLSLHDALPIFFNYPGRTFASKVATRSDAVGKAQHRLCSPRIFAERRGRGLFEKAGPRCCRSWSSGATAHQQRLAERPMAVRHDHAFAGNIGNRLC